MNRPTFYEFFAGGGMARLGLGEAWRCLFANDYDRAKAASYAANWGDDHLIRADVATLTFADLPAQADMAWASFPCQDLSLAGSRAGLGDSADGRATRSGTFWPFWALMEALEEQKRAPRLIVLENVPGALTSRGGADFAAIAGALTRGGYRFGALVIDAVHFVPQSRPRLFVVGARDSVPLPERVIQTARRPEWSPAALIRAQAALSAPVKRQWVWWRLPAPAERSATLADIIEKRPVDVKWHAPDVTKRLLAMMSPSQRKKVDEVASRRGATGCVYRRTRPDPDGSGHQRAEVRFDGVAGCLRTPAGGSSRQTIIVVEGNRVRSRLLSAREAARLMGLPDDYRLPARYSEAYRLAGDGVCPPVVRHLARHLLEPILGCDGSSIKLMAAE